MTSQITRWNHEHIKPDAATKFLAELLGGMTSVYDGFAFFVEGRRFEFDYCHPCLIFGLIHVMAITSKSAKTSAATLRKNDVGLSTSRYWVSDGVS